MKIYLFIFLSLCLSFNLFGQNKILNQLPVSEDLPQMKRGNIGFGDFTGDGKIDLVFISDIGVKIFKQKPNADNEHKFEKLEAVSTLNLEGTRSVFVGNLNNDSKPEIIACYSIPILWFFNTTAQDWSTYEIKGYLNEMVAAWGDMTGDGITDMVITGSKNSDGSGKVIRILEGKTGSFYSLTEYKISNVDGGPMRGTTEGDIKLGDLDGDGDLDIITAGNHKLLIYRNDRNGDFKEMGHHIIGTAKSALDLGDCDGDGDLDFILSGETESGKYITKIFKNITPKARVSNTYKENSTKDIIFDHWEKPLCTSRTPEGIPCAITGVINGHVAWADINLDGMTDFVVSGYKKSESGNPSDEKAIVEVYIQEVGSVFNLKQELIGVADFRNDYNGIGREGGSLSWIDYDNDGDPDLIYSGWNPQQGKGITKIYRNTTK